jgi:hypothetical protein
MAKERKDEVRDLLSLAERDKSGRLTPPHVLGLLRRYGADDARKILADALANPGEKRVFWRLAVTLARLSQEWGQPADLPNLAAFGSELLVEYARKHARFPGLAVRAISYCSDETKLVALVDLMEKGRFRQRRAAPMALARTGLLQAIVPLGRNAAQSSPIRMEALAALRSMGRPDPLAVQALKAQHLSERERLEILKALSVFNVYIFPLSYTAFDPERWLTQQIKRGGQIGLTAAALLARLKDEKQLLRGSQPSTSDSLLRAARSAPSRADTTLLRASGAAENVSASPASSGTLVKVARRIRTVFVRRT